MNEFPEEILLNYEEVLYQRTIDPDIVQSLIFSGQLIDGRRGGMVIGRRHKHGHIYLFRTDENGLFLEAKMEGGEYLVNKNATKKHKLRLDAIWREHRETETNTIFPCTEVGRVVYTHSSIQDIGIFIDGGQFIASRYCTSKFIQELVEINEFGQPENNLFKDILKK
jgi:hypothetical protein